MHFCWTRTLLRLTFVPTLATFKLETLRRLRTHWRKRLNLVTKHPVLMLRKSANSSAMKLTQRKLLRPRSGPKQSTSWGQSSIRPLTLASTLASYSKWWSSRTPPTWLTPSLSLPRCRASLLSSPISCFGVVESWSIMAKLTWAKSILDKPFQVSQTAKFTNSSGKTSRKQTKSRSRQLSSSRVTRRKF